MRFEGTTFADSYNQALAWLKDAKEYSPRGMKTKEMLGCQLWWEESSQRLAFCKERKFSLAFALAETIWVREGREDLAFVEHYNKRYAQFSDDGVKLHGAYGPRSMSTIKEALAKIKRDADTRQAVITIYRNEDMLVSSKDIPCTLAWQLFSRDGFLNMITTMRSNDIFWGVPYDVFVCTMLQEAWARYLGLKPGWYCHQSASLHVYERHYDWLDMEFKDAEMPGFVDSMFMRSLSVAEKHARNLEQVLDPKNPLVGDCSWVLCWHNAKRQGIPYEPGNDDVGEWARMHVEAL